MHTFGIIGFQRTGTTALLRGLMQIDGIDGFPWEISLPTLMAEPGYSVLKVEAPDPVLDTLANGFLGNLRLWDGPSQPKAWGWKTAVGNADGIEGSLARLRRIQPNLRLIACERTDLVGQIGSALRAGATGRWQSWEGAGQITGTGQSLRATIDPRYLLWLLNETERLQRIINASGMSVKWINFETAFIDLPATLHELVNFIGVESPAAAIEAVPNEGKVSPPPADFIDHYAELSDLLNRLRESDNRPEVLRKSLRVSERLRLGVSRRVARGLEQLSR